MWERLAQEPELFVALQIGVITLGIGYGLWRLWARGQESRFGLREWERLGREQTSRVPGGDTAASARPAALPGFVSGLPAHETLGVRLDASRSEIQSAYKRLMKRYHPDRVARPGTPAWQQAQAIAHEINAARETLLSRLTS